MGQKQRNVEAVTDYADGRHFVRLHRDILLPASVCEAVRRHLAAGQWAEARTLTLEHAPVDSHPEVDLFLTPRADRPIQNVHADSTAEAVVLGSEKLGG